MTQDWKIRTALLALLVGLADVLFYGQAVGLSLALFAGAVFLVAVWDHLRPAPIALLILSVLPVIDFVQPLSLAFLGAGLVASITMTRFSGQGLARASLVLAAQIPWRLIHDATRAARDLRGQFSLGAAMGKAARAWAFPLGGLLILFALLVRCAALGLGALYLCAFVNFAAVIARVNVAEDRVDLSYLCSLGPTAAADLPARIRNAKDNSCDFATPRIDGWRDWGFRNQLVRHYLAAKESAHENPRRR